MKDFSGRELQVLAHALMQIAESEGYPPDEVNALARKLGVKELTPVTPRRDEDMMLPDWFWRGERRH
jgi:hypothetical protein